MIELTVMTLDSNNHKFRVPKTYTVLELKKFIAAQVNVEVDQQRLIFCGRVLSNETKLASIGINGKVMHLVHKVPNLSTTTSRPSSTTTNTNSDSRQNEGLGLRGFNPLALFDAMHFPSELMHVGELPHISSIRDHENYTRVAFALDVIRRGNNILNRLENPPQSSSSDAEECPEVAQQAEASSPSVPPEGVGTLESSLPESSVLQPQTDPNSLNMIYEVDETFPNSLLVTFNGAPELISQVRDYYINPDNLVLLHRNSTETSAESEVSNVPVGGLTNQSSAEQASGTFLEPSSASPGQHLRNDRQTSENRSTVNNRRRFGELIEELNKLNERLRPFYAIYGQFVIDDPRFDTTEGENGSLRAQSIFDDVSEVLHCISHVYHIISEMRVEFNRAPPRSEVGFNSRPCFRESPILHFPHSVTTTNAAAPPTTQQPTSTLTSTTSRSIPIIQTFGLDCLGGSDTSNVATSATETNTNTNMSVNPNTESNNTSTETPRRGEYIYALAAPGSLSIDSAGTAFINPIGPAATSLPTLPRSQCYTPDPFSTIADPAAPIDWVDQMIDIISSGVQSVLMPGQSVTRINRTNFYSNSIPTASIQSPCVTPRVTESISQDSARWLESTPRMDPIVPDSSRHSEPNTRPILRARRYTQRRTNRSTSSGTSGNSATDASPTSPNEDKSFTS